MIDLLLLYRVYFIYASLLLILFSCSKKKSNKDRLNVLLIYADDLNNRLGYCGDSIAITPNIDELANSGVAFMDWGNNEFELYDLKNDPYQFTNLAKQMPEKLKELQQKINQTYP